MSPKARRFIIIVLYCLMASTLASGSLAYLKRHSFGYTMASRVDMDWSSLTTYSTIATHNWIHYGLARSNFLPNLDLVAPEKGATCYCYRSYPSGTFLLPYFFSKLTGLEPSDKMMMWFSACAMWLATFIFCLTILYLCDLVGIATPLCATLAMGSALLLNFFPLSILMFQTVWWPDLAGLPFFIGAIFLELLRLRNGNRSQKLDIVIAGWLALGVSIDWLNLYLLVFIALFRWLDEKRRANQAKLFILAAPSLLMLGVFVWLAARNDGYLLIFEKIKERVGLFQAPYGWDGKPLPNVFSKFWVGTLLSFFGIQNYLFIAASLTVGSCVATLNWFRARDPLSLFCALLFLPCIVHALVFRQHYALHHYNALKFTFVAAAGISVSMILISMKAAELKLRWAPYGVTALFLILGLFTARGALRIYDSAGYFLGQPSAAQNTYLGKVAFAEFVRNHATYPQIIFSDNLFIEPIGGLLVQVVDPMNRARKIEGFFYLASHSFKYVYLAASPEDARTRLKNIPIKNINTAELLYLTSAKESVRPTWRSALKEVLAESSDYRLYRISLYPNSP